MITVYTADLGVERVTWLTGIGSAIACAGLTGRVWTAPANPAVMVFEEDVADVLRAIPDDHDGHMSGEEIWFGGISFLVQRDTVAI